MRPYSGTKTFHPKVCPSHGLDVADASWHLGKMMLLPYVSKRMQRPSHLLLFKFYLFGCAGSLLLVGLFSSCGRQGLLSTCSAWASQWGGFSPGEAQAPGCVAFSSCGSPVPEHRLRSWCTWNEHIFNRFPIFFYICFLLSPFSTRMVFKKINTHLIFLIN